MVRDLLAIEDYKTDPYTATWPRSSIPRRDCSVWAQDMFEVGVGDEDPLVQFLQSGTGLGAQLVDQPCTDLAVVLQVSPGRGATSIHLHQQDG